VPPPFSPIVSGATLANIWSLVPANVQTTMNFEPHCEVLIWRDAGETATSVFVLATPHSNGVSPAPGNSIGYLYHKLADGEIESVAARNVLTYVVQKSLSSSPVSSATVQSPSGP
jgi:hypothetical protein